MLRFSFLPCKALLLVLIFFTSTVTAYPEGSGSCDGGKAAVGGSHLTESKITTGSLADGGYNVTLGRRELLTDTVASTFTRIDTLLRVKGPAFTGILIRMEAPSGVNTKTALITDDTNLKTCDLCEYPVQGVTHNSATEKKVADATFSLRTATEDIFFDITIVVKNDSTGSTYYYSRFPVQTISRTNATPSPGGGGDGGAISTPAPVARTRRPSSTTTTSTPAPLARTRRPSSTTTTSTPAPAQRTRRPSSTTTTSTPAPAQRTRRPSSTTTTSTPAPAQRTRRPSSSTSTSTPGSTTEPTTMGPTTSAPPATFTFPTVAPTSWNGASDAPTTLPPAIVTSNPSSSTSFLSDIPTMVPTDMGMPSMGIPSSESPSPGESLPVNGTNPAPGTYPACHICDADQTINNPTGAVIIQNVSFTCEQLETSAMSGLVDPAQCRKLQMSLSTLCACLASGATLAPSSTVNAPPPVVSPSASNSPSGAATLNYLFLYRAVWGVTFLLLNGMLI